MVRKRLLVAVLAIAITVTALWLTGPLKTVLGGSSGLPSKIVKCGKLERGNVMFSFMHDVGWRTGKHFGFRLMLLSESGYVEVHLGFGQVTLFNVYGNVTVLAWFNNDTERVAVYINGSKIVEYAMPCYNYTVITIVNLKNPPIPGFVQRYRQLGYVNISNYAVSIDSGFPFLVRDNFTEQFVKERCANPSDFETPRIYITGPVEYRLVVYVPER